MDLTKKKQGQAAIEFLMTYGWMLLVVLIVGALIFSFVDFGSLLPNKLDLSNNLLGDATRSVAYSNEHTAPNGSTALANQAKVIFRYNGAKRVTIPVDGGQIETELNSVCNSTELENLDTGTIKSTAGEEVPFLNGQDGLITFNCSGIDGGQGLLPGDNLVGTISIVVKDPKSQLRIPSTGSIRLQVIE